MDFQLNLNDDSVRHAPLAQPLVAPPTTPLREALGLLKEHNTGGLLVCDGDRLVGIYTERDALRVMSRMANDPDCKSELDDPIERHMSKNPLSLSEDDSMATAIAKMSGGGFRRLPILNEDGKPASMIKVSGILRYLVEHFPNVIYTLPPKPHQAMTEREGA